MVEDDSSDELQGPSRLLQEPIVEHPDDDVRPGIFMTPVLYTWISSLTCFTLGYLHYFRSLQHCFSSLQTLLKSCNLESEHSSSPDFELVL